MWADTCPRVLFIEMELRHLRYFVAVAEELHFGRAAQRLHLAQQPLSAQIKDLERELGVQLFIRGENRIRLSEAGQSFLEEARITLAHSHRAAEVARLAANGQMGRLRIGFCSSAVREFFPEVLKSFKAASPSVSVELQETYDQLKLLEGRELDLAFVHVTPEMTLFNWIPILSERFVVAAPEHHPLIALSEVGLTLDHLKPYTLVALPLEKVRPFQAFLESWAAYNGFRPTVSQTAGDKQTLLGLVAAGFGIAIVPEHVRSAPAPAGLRFLALNAPAALLQLGAVWRKDNPQASLRRFLDHLKNYIDRPLDPSQSSNSGR